MAARGIALGRIIDWARNADPEEVAYVHQRIGKIILEHADSIARADAHHQAKTKKSHHKPKRVPVIAEDIREAEIAAQQVQVERTEKDTKTDTKAASAS